MQRQRVAVAVAPRLLADALATVLRAEGFAVTVVAPDVLDVKGLELAFDVVIVSGFLAADPSVEVLIRLPDPVAADEGAVITRDGARAITALNLDQLVSLVQRYGAGVT
jgi:hypothetical protein